MLQPSQRKFLFVVVLIAAISGGTDVAASYVGACPIQPVYAGEMQCRYLGTAVYAMDDDGRIYAVMVPDVCGNVSVHPG